MTEHPSRPGAFAAAIARRYGDVPLIAPLVDMIVRLNPTSPGDRICSFETRVQMAPRVMVTVNTPPASASRLEPTCLHQTAPLAIVQRLAHRRRRLEPDANPPAALRPARVPSAGSMEMAAAPPAAAGAPAVPAPRPLPMIVRRRGGETPAGTAGTGRPDAGGPPQTFERHAAPRRHADERLGGKPPAGLDLEQLTEKVVRAIDRRIVAYRERTARS